MAGQLNYIYKDFRGPSRIFLKKGPLRSRPSSLVDYLNSGDLQGILETAAKYYLQITQQDTSSAHFFTTTDGEKIKIDARSIREIPLYREESYGKMLVLVNPKQTETVLAMYLKGTWWPLDEILRASVPSREGLLQVQTFGDRVALFALNCLVCGFAENAGLEDGVRFLPHSAGELARILWHCGGLCSSSNSQCYLLPVLDTIFVRTKWRRQGFGTKMLQDYCKTFARESALGISCPISTAMYHVCAKFLMDHPKERDRLWEVDAPGDWSQRTNIWLSIQLREAPAIQKTPSVNIIGPADANTCLLEGHSQDLDDKQKPVSSENDLDVVFKTQLDSKNKRHQEDSNEEIIPKQRKTN
ncbi:protein FAM169B-like [Spea bombifrons]|uniref:protein FAM169B-like n=1 Tax=Spea bombifrons TaxID=233779 RepID=UPI00234B6E3F|nr:protein FAM169B-like [Spea bombifrons]